jgi:cytochrome c-type biogenesis protein CcmE
MKKNKKISIVLSVFLIVGAFAYIAFSSFGESMIYYKTVDELLAQKERFTETPVRINGALVPDSVRQKPGTNQYRFQISKRGRVLEVAYAGVLPDVMTNDQELVVQGIYKTDQELFEASEILTKCPSKHEARAKQAGP